MSSRKQRNIPLGGRYRQVSLYMAIFSHRILDRQKVTVSVLYGSFSIFIKRSQQHKPNLRNRETSRFISNMIIFIPNVPVILIIIAWIMTSPAVPREMYHLRQRANAVLYWISNIHMIGHFDNFQCSQSRQYLQSVNIFVSVVQFYGQPIISSPVIQKQYASHNSWCFHWRHVLDADNTVVAKQLI